MLCNRRSVWFLHWRLCNHLVIIWPIGMQSRAFLHYELSFGASLAKVGRLDAENKTASIYIYSMTNLKNFFTVRRQKI